MLQKKFVERVYGWGQAQKMLIKAQKLSDHDFDRVFIDEEIQEYFFTIVFSLFQYAQYSAYLFYLMYRNPLVIHF